MTYGLKTQFSGITVSTFYRKSIFQIEWFIATLICKLATLKLRKNYVKSSQVIKLVRMTLKDFERFSVNTNKVTKEFAVSNNMQI